MRLSACVVAAFLAASCGPASENGAPDPNATAGRAVTVELPPELPEPPPQSEAEPKKEEPPPAVEEKEAEPEPAEKAEKPKPRIEVAEKAVSAPEPAASAEEPTETAPSSEPRLVRSQLPISEGALVRTIERIGYECGSVVGADRQEGEGEPVYKINCSSGASYRGTTRNGRLFFRPWGARPSRR